VEYCPSSLSASLLNLIRLPRSQASQNCRYELSVLLDSHKPFVVAIGEPNPRSWATPEFSAVLRLETQFYADLSAAAAVDAQSSSDAPSLIRTELLGATTALPCLLSLVRQAREKGALASADTGRSGSEAAHAPRDPSEEAALPAAAASAAEDPGPAVVGQCAASSQGGVSSAGSGASVVPPTSADGAAVTAASSAVSRLFAAATPLQAHEALRAAASVIGPGGPMGARSAFLQAGGVELLVGPLSDDAIAGAVGLQELVIAAAVGGRMSTNGIDERDGLAMAFLRAVEARGSDALRSLTHATLLAHVAGGNPQSHNQGSATRHSSSPEVGPGTEP
jgi:hypothetical protein